jgi:plasmid rolling circle replication initiator protein Rep
MKKSYVKEETLEILVDIKLGDVAQLIDVLQNVANEEGGSNNWKATDLLRKLKELRREAAEEARREFQSMLERT